MYPRASKPERNPRARAKGLRANPPSDVGGFGDLATIGVPPAVVLPRAAGIDGALRMAVASDDMEPDLAHLRAHGLEPA
jgi:hypothetical protein